MATRTQIILRARQKADLVNSTHITSADETDLFQEAFKEVYSLFGENGFHMIDTDSTLSLTAGVATLPSDFFAVINVFKVIGSDYHYLERVDPQLEAAVRSLTGNEGMFYKVKRTALNARTITIYPAPTSGTYILQYCPEAPSPGASDAVPEVGLSNVALTALLAEKFLAKQNEQNPVISNEYAKVAAEVRRQAEIVEMTRPGRIQNTRQRQMRDAFDYQVYGGEYEG